VDGTISISGTVIPLQFTSPLLSGGNFSWNGTGGVAGGTYYVLSSPDVGQPLSSWVPVGTNLFDGSGNFNFSEAIDPGLPTRFYLISAP
jgi:hypothetical protein